MESFKMDSARCLPVHDKRAPASAVLPQFSFLGELASVRAEISDKVGVEVTILLRFL